VSPTEIIDRALLRSMRSDARLAAMIILAEPSRIGDEPIYEFLMHIKCIRRETVKGWLDAARVNPLRPGRELTSDQRRAIARQLTDFWKAGQS
jgi:hypothetical protein